MHFSIVSCVDVLCESCVSDDEVVKREEEAIKLDGLNVAQMRELREKAEKFQFQTEVNRMMKLIINSLYRNKEVRFFYFLKFFYYISFY